VGVLPGFPPHLGLAYWGPNFDVFLVSLGHIQRCGGYYVGKGDFLTIHNIDGTILDHVPLLSNNLCPVHIGDPSSSLAFVSRRYTAEEIAHMNVAENLHIFYDHPSDEVLIEGINYGHVPTHITATAVVNNRALRGPCPHCIVGKITNDPMPVSLTEPESRLAQTLSQDVHQLHVPTSSGRTHKSNIVDHRSGHFGVITHSSKKATDITMDVKKYIATQYNAHGHKVENLLNDAEGVYTKASPDFGSFGVAMHMTPPNQHAQRVERYTRTADDRKRSVLSGLSFILPSKYDIYLDVHVAKMMNDLPNSLTTPLTPTIVVEGVKPKFHTEYPLLPFGAVCMVQQYASKIASQALANDVATITVPKAELGVCMGEDPKHRGSYIFLVANGEVVPRRVIRRVNVHPWDWKRKFSPTAELIVPRVPRYNNHVQQGPALYVDPTTSVPLATSPTPLLSPVSDLDLFDTAIPSPNSVLIDSVPVALFPRDYPTPVFNTNVSDVINEFTFIQSPESLLIFRHYIQYYIHHN
jgi:hypothetical protein